MERATVVIGANYGDEGKGKTVDALCARYGQDTLAIRFSGGANAGHTVELPDGRRHVFGHFGSGTMAGCKTMLSRDFIVNPILFKKERDELKSKGFDPEIWVDPSARVTTPYDVFINQAIERARGNQRHGSCGVGINETVVRSEVRWDDFYVPAADLVAPTVLASRLEHIAEAYLPERLDELGIPADLSMLASPKKFADTMVSAAEGLWLYEEKDASNHKGHVVFEGSQGLGLDEYYGEFPYVTRSRTGLTNVVRIARSLGIEGLDILYLTRAYGTRHGKGPFPEFISGLTYEDKTNVHNEFQGEVRFGSLDVIGMVRRIKRDLTICRPMNASVGIGISCMDQVSEMVTDGVEQMISDFSGLPVAFTSTGPTRDDIQWRTANV
jgi:adenylosuccinate synthase